jgi:hypothetical protein
VVLDATAEAVPTNGSATTVAKEGGQVAKTLLRAFLLTIFIAAFALVGAQAGRAGDTGDSQLLDVNKQVNSIQKKLNELLTRGGSARPGQLLASADCGYAEPAQVFLPWADAAAYALAPQGDLAESDGWTLNKQATVVDGADPFTGAPHSLALQNGGQAATPAMCVNLDNPTVRFFVRDVGGNGKSNLKVDLLYEDLNGHVSHLTIARLKAGTDWQPSLILPIYMNMLALASPSGVTAVAFHFKAEGLQKDETVQISSLYVDPFSSR